MPVLLTVWSLERNEPLGARRYATLVGGKLPTKGSNLHFGEGVQAKLLPVHDVVPRFGRGAVSIVRLLGPEALIKKLVRSGNWAPI